MQVVVVFFNHRITSLGCFHLLFPKMGVPPPKRKQGVTKRVWVIPGLNKETRKNMVKIGKMISGWWYTYPSEKYEFVSWDYEIPKIWKIKAMFQTTNQKLYI
jgi:hypothetical protein